MRTGVFISENGEGENGTVDLANGSLFTLRTENCEQEQNQQNGENGNGGGGPLYLRTETADGEMVNSVLVLVLFSTHSRDSHEPPWMQA